MDSSNHADYGTHIANAVTAGCTEPGYTGDTVCDGCGAVLEAGEELAALGHDFDDWTDNGETHIRTCFRCGEEEEAAHVWDDGETVSTATCKTPGSVKYNCTLCVATKTEQTEKNPAKIVFVATCKTPGSVKYNCTLCVATKTEQTEKNPANHADYGTHLANAVAAGCTEPGYTGDTVCDGCGAVLEAGEAISALGHDFDDWTDNGETHIRTCFRCGEEEEAAHGWDGGEIVSTATCKTPGSVKYNCTLCVATKTEQTEKNPANRAA